MKVKFPTSGMYNGQHYAEGEVVEVDDNFGKYVVGMKNAEEVKEEPKKPAPKEEK